MLTYEEFLREFKIVDCELAKSMYEMYLVYIKNKDRE